MMKEQFMKLKVGDKVRYGDHEFHVYMIETALNEERIATGTWKVYNNQFQSIEITDEIVPNLMLVSEPAAKHMTRVELVVSGIDPDTKGWEFMEQAIEEAIESYGGEVTEYNVVNQ